MRRLYNAVFSFYKGEDFGMTGYDVINTYETLVSIADSEFDLATSCAIAKNISELQIYVNVIESKRKKFIEEFGEKDENENIIKVKDVDSFNKAMNEILSEKIEVNLTKIKGEKFSDIKISPAKAMWLIKIIE